MHIAKPFRATGQEQVLDAINAIRLGTLVSFTNGNFAATPLPWVVRHADGAIQLDTHLARANPQLAALEPGLSVFVNFTGTNGYVSPRWLPTPRSAPTWNYIAVHVTGRSELLDDAETERVVEALVSAQEGDAPDAWNTRALGDRRDRLLPHVCGLRVHVEDMAAKFKLGQNESDVDCAAIIHALEQTDPGSGLARAMREANAHRVTRDDDQR